MKGVDDLAEDMVTWDLDRSVLTVRIGSRRMSQVRVAELLIALQRRLISQPGTSVVFEGKSSAASVLTINDLKDRSVELPKTLVERRTRVYTLLSENAQRDTAESAQWTSELHEAVTAYLGSYRRALDAADIDILPSLLSMDSLNLSTRMAHGNAIGVVLLPLHPLRLAWIGQHHALLRGWATNLLGLSRGQRRRAVDAQLAARVQPANLPFTLLTAWQEPVVYFDELTFGSALYLPADTDDPEADAAALCAAIGVERGGASSWPPRLIKSPSGSALSSPPIQVSPGSGDHQLNPGSGDLLADALRQAIGVQQAENRDPIRAEVIAYSDRSSYTQPVGRLQDLQADLRVVTRSMPSSHLTPPLSVAHRPVNQPLRDAEAAHIALVQGLATASIDPAASPPERSPSLNGLLVPSVTSSHATAGAIRLVTSPASRSPVVSGCRPHCYPTEHMRQE